MFVNMPFKLNLAIHHGVLGYICESEYARQYWNIRGIAGKQKREVIKELEENMDQEIFEKMRQERNKIKLQEYLAETYKLFEAIINSDTKSLAQYIDGRNFYFIIGGTRTGGTYAQKEMGRALGWPITDFLHCMIHDAIPHTQYIVDANGLMRDDFIIWRQPFNYYNFMFQLSQLLVYLNRVAKVNRSIVLKHAYFCYCLPLVDEVFGKYAKYIVTIRHPASTAASRAESLGVDIKDQGFMEFCFNEWQRCYRTIVGYGVPKDRISAVLFGEEMDSLLEQFFRKNNYRGEPDGVKTTKRVYDYNWWNDVGVVGCMEGICKLWEQYGLKFPIPTRIE